MIAFKSVSVRIYILGLFEALLTAACYTAAVFALHPIDAATYLDLEGGGLRIGLLSVTFLIATYLFDLHRQAGPSSRLLLALQLCQLVGILLLVQAALAFVSPGFVLQQSVTLAGSGLLLVTLIVWRLVFRPTVWAGFGALRVVFVGNGQAVEQLCAAFTTDAFRTTEVVGFIGNEEDAPSGVRVLGPAENLMDIVAETHPDRIVVDGTSITDPAVLRNLLDCSASGMIVQTASQAYEAEFARVDCRGLHPYQVVFLDTLSSKPGSIAAQAVYTNILALAAAAVCVPLLLVISFLKRVTSRGRILVKYRCIGLHGIPFSMYQFSCPPGVRNPVDRFLRHYRLLGLPQVLNLIRGEIALLGPRPERAEIDDVMSDLVPFYRQKQSVKPGLFGWSQLHCDGLPYEDSLRRLEYDLYYIKHISVALDIYIVLSALRWILSGERSATDVRYAGDMLQGI